MYCFIKKFIQKNKKSPLNYYSCLMETQTIKHLYTTYK